MNNRFRMQHLHNSSLIKRGVGRHIYLMFAGKAHRPEDPEVPIRPHGLQKLIPILLLLCVACMIGIVIWRQLSAMR